MPSKVRIIGGQWRGRNIELLNLKSLRPTPDRVRETLFNWLSPSIVGTKCLDLFAGSGALGFEALSRGAACIVLVDNNVRICKQLNKQAQILNASNISVVHQEAIEFIATNQESFDIVFIDPPFKSKLGSILVNMLLEHPMLSNEAILYVEMSLSDKPKTPKTWMGWNILRSGKTSQVCYLLLTKSGSY